MVNVRGWPSADELSRKIDVTLHEVLSLMEQPLTHHQIDIALKGKVTRWSWRFAFENSPWCNDPKNIGCCDVNISAYVAGCGDSFAGFRTSVLPDNEMIRQANEAVADWKRHVAEIDAEELKSQ